MPPPSHMHFFPLFSLLTHPPSLLPFSPLYLYHHKSPWHGRKRRKEKQIIKVSWVYYQKKKHTQKTLSASKFWFWVDMEVAVELEDDLFFADLSKQISLLIMDDDDDQDPVARCPSVSFQTFSGANYPIAGPYLQEQICRREISSKGTGVFIPRSSQPRRKQRQGRNSSFSSKSNRLQQHGNSTKMVPPSYSNSFYPRKG